MWCHFGDKMSPENQGIFQLLKKKLSRRLQENSPEVA
jgi:hypothetical protein